VTKTAVPAEGTSVAPGSTITYSIVIANGVTEAATGVTLTDPTPANTTYVAGSATIDDGTVIDPAINPFASTLSIADIPVSDSTTATFQVTVNSSLANGTTLTNTATVTAANADPVSDLSDDAVHTVIAPVLTVDKTSTPLEGETVDPGDTIDYSIEIANTGGDAATGVVLLDDTPENTEYVAGSATIDDGTVIDASTNPFADPGLDIEDIPAAGTTTATFQVTVSSPLPNDTVISNSATVSAGNHADVSDDADVTVTSTPGLTMAKTAFPAEAGKVTPGATINYTIVVTNAAEATEAATEITLTDPTPANTTYVAGSAKLGDTAITGEANPFTAGYALPDLEPGASATVTFDVKVASPLAKGTVVSNLAKLTADNHPDVEDGATHTVDSTPVMKVLVSSDPKDGSKLKGGDKIDYKVDVTNDPTASDSLQNVVVKAPTPSGTTYVDGSAKLDGAPASSSSGQLLAAGPSPLASGYALGTMAPGSSHSLTYSVRVKASADEIEGTITVEAANITAVTATTSHRGPSSGSGGGGGGDDDEGSAFGLESDSGTAGSTGSGELAFTGLDLARLLTLAMSLFLVGWTLLARGRSVQRRTAGVGPRDNEISPGFPVWDRWSGAWFFPDSKK
jgi:uncharacterized repeat protein (TIGR01451 family)